MKLTLEHLENCFNQAKAENSKYLGILVTVIGGTGREVIINPQENFDAKLTYFKEAYDEDLNKKGIEGLSILGFTHGDSYDDIEQQLLGTSTADNGYTVEELIQSKACFDIGLAREFLLEGYKIARKVWPLDTYIYLVKGQVVDASQLRNEAKERVTEHDTVQIIEHIDMKTTEGKIIVGWTPDTGSIFATDYFIVE